MESMESQPGPCSLFIISDELVLFKIWACQSFTQLVSKFPVSDSPAPKLQVCRNCPLTKFSLPKLSQDEIPPPPPPQLYAPQVPKTLVAWDIKWFGASPENEADDCAIPAVWPLILVPQSSAPRPLAPCSLGKYLRWAHVLRWLWQERPVWVPRPIPAMRFRHLVGDEVAEGTYGVHCRAGTVSCRRLG